MKSQAADFTDVQADSNPPHADRAAAADAVAQHLLAEEEKEAAKAAAKKSKKQKQKVKKQLRQQQQQEEEPSTPENAGSPTTSDHEQQSNGCSWSEQQSNGLEAAVTAEDGASAEAGGVSQATPDASSQTSTGSDRPTHHPHALDSDPDSLSGITDPPLHDLSTADSHGAADLHPGQGASGVADATDAEDAATITSSFETLDMNDTGQIARLLSCPITKVGPIAMRASTCKLLGSSQSVCWCLLHSAVRSNHAMLCCVGL